MSFPKISLKRVVSKIGSGKTPSGGSDVYTSDGVVFLRSQNIHFDGLRLDDVVRIPSNVHQEMASSAVSEADILLNITGASLGRVALAPANLGPANVNQHVCICRPNRKRIEPKFLLYSMQSRSVQDAIWGNQNGSSREGLNFQEVGQLTIAIPPIGTQRAIADFLDRKTAAIDALIQKKEKLIELLEEKRAALINQAVTKGLDPNVPMKDSGIPWIGEIPAHWDITQAKRLSAIFVPQRDKPTLNREAGYPWITTDLLGAALPRLDADAWRVAKDAAQDARSRTCPPDSVLVACVGRFGIASVADQEVIINQQIQAFFPKRVSPFFLRLCVSSSRVYFETVATQTTIAYVNGERMGEMPVALPPSDEQREIVNAVERIERRTGRALVLLRTQLDRLQEYRQSVITAAVTKQLEIEADQGET